MSNRIRLLEYDVNRGEGNSFLVEKKRGGVLRIIGHQNGLRVENTKEDVYVSVDSKNAYVMSSVFPKAKKEILRLQIDERIRREAVLDEEITLVHRIKRLSSTEGHERLSIVSLPASDISVPLDIALNNQNLRMRGIFTEASSIAGLIGALTPEPIMAIIVRENSMEILVCQEKVPLYTQMAPLDVTGAIDTESVGRTLDFVRQNVERLHNVQVDKAICLGKGREAFQDRIGDYKLWDANLNTIIETESPSLVLQHPGAFGAYFALKEYDLTPSHFKIAYRVRTSNAVLAGVLFVSALFLSIWTANLYRKNEILRKKYEALFNQVADKKERLEAIIPPDTQKTFIERYVRIYKKSKEQPVIHEELLRLSSLLPDKVKILSFEISRDSLATTGAISTTPPGSPQTFQPPEMQSSSNVEHYFDMPLKMNMVLVTKGTFVEARTRFERTVSNLASVYNVDNVKWNYDKKNKMGRLTCDVILPGRS